MNLSAQIVLPAALMRAFRLTLISCVILALAAEIAYAQPNDEQGEPGTELPGDIYNPEVADDEPGTAAGDPTRADAPDASTTAATQIEIKGATVEGELDQQSDAEPAEAAAKMVESAGLGFGFGSYGRIGIGTDLRGGSPSPTQVVAHGPRVVEPNYIELDMYYRLRTKRDIPVTAVATLAFNDTLFHYTGEFDAQPAIRNFYLQTNMTDELSMWVGSRMYRGDDIYLLDYWPLDDLNTVGAGARYADDRLDLAFHVGANRLLNAYQYQEREVVAPEFGSTTVVQLDRQRLIASSHAAYRFVGEGEPDELNAMGKIYVEIQSLPDGTRLRPDDTKEALPSDFGLTVGGQLAAWGFAEGRSHANFFARLSKGLAAFDELAPPMGFDNNLKTFSKATETVLGFSANFEAGPGAIVAGGYTRRFVDADKNSADRDDGWEYVVAARPQVSVNDDVHVAMDLAYQVRFPRGISPTALVALDPAIWHVAPMLLYSPFGNSPYDRPQFRLVYRAAHLNEGALDLYAIDDPRRSDAWVHYLGVQAEWWFNSTYR